MGLTPDDIATLPRDSREAFLAALINHVSARNLLELGVWEGKLAAHLLANCPAIERYTMLDPWRNLEGWNKPFNRPDAEFETIYQAALQATEFAAEKRHILRGTTLEVIDAIPDASLDCAYIDGDHTLRGITIDLTCIWPKLRGGGMIICDDFTPHPWQHGRGYDPSLVFPYALHFAEAVGATAIAPGLNQCVLVKGQGGYTFHDLTGAYADRSLARLRRNSLWDRLWNRRR